MVNYANRKTLLVVIVNYLDGVVQFLLWL